MSPRFQITKWGPRCWEVSGVISVRGRLKAEMTRRLVATRKEAQALAARWDRIEAEAEISIAEARERRLQRAWAYLEKRARRTDPQLSWDF